MNNNTWGWIVGVVVIVLIILGLWWYVAANPSAGGMATTTPQTATTTQSGTAVEVRSSSSVASIVAGLAGAGTFNSYLNATGVASSIAGKGPYTVFVPSDGAFAALPSGTVSSLSAAAQKRLVQYHIVSGKALDINAESNGTFTALSKDPLNFRADLTYKEAFVNSGYAIHEYKASNGIVYLISAVLIPPQLGATTTGSTGTPHP